MAGPSYKYASNYMAGMGVSPYKPKPLSLYEKKPKTTKTNTKTPPKLSPFDALYKRLTGQLRTPAQLEADARRLAGEQLTSSTTLLRSESERLRAAADKRRQTLTNAMLAAAGENAAMAPQILGGYQSAAQGLGQLGALASGAVGDAVRADIASQTEALARVGQAGPTLDASQQQGVENYVGGYLPASTLAAMGANANAGYLGQVAASRLGAVERPWKDYEETISQLDDSELTELAKIESSRPDLVAKILDNLMGNQTDINSTIVKIEQEKRQVRAANARINAAEEELKYKYAKARADASNDTEKRLLDDWYKRQQVKLSQARNEISQQNANISQQNADISRDKETRVAKETGPDGVKWKTIGEVQAQAGRSRRDIPRGQSRAKIKNALFLQYSGMIRPEKRAAFKAWVSAWVDSLPLQQKSGSSSGFPTVPAK